MRKFIISYYIVYVLVITYYSLTPEESIFSDYQWDKAIHFFTYVILVILIKNVHVRLSYLSSLLICCNYSFIIECFQYYIPNRQLEVLDMLANLLGTLLGLIIYYLIIEKYSNNRRGDAAEVVNK